MENENVIGLSQVSKTYGEGANRITALRNASVEFRRGEFTAVIGKSGSGKSTLLNMISGIDRPTSGEITHGDNLLHDMSENELAIWRGRNIGMVFQFFQLIPTLTVLENLLLPMDFCGIVPSSLRRAKAERLLNRTGVARYADSLPLFLSGGEQQRVAVARSLVNDPAFVIADEPTGNLDTQNARCVTALLRELSAEGKSVVMVTHNQEMADAADRVLSIHDGEIAADTGTVAV
ncbi:MAG: ABC transporter ATP-binding protein [Clostridia bacterium]|nr:ABC transporter ATP-binding protein [Clostridia bacterium]